MKGLYIDLGCYDGDSVLSFMQWAPFFTPGTEWKIFAIDPNPDVVARMTNLADYRDYLTFINEAAWIKNTTMDFTVRPRSRPLGSSMMKNKNDWGMGDVVQVKAFDFSSWLAEQWQSDFYGQIVVKIDIEGAEYDVLQNLIDDGNSGLVDAYLVEWHGNKLAEGTRSYAAWQKEIIATLKTRGSRVEEWK